jgi:hypothetical protein
MTTGPAIVTRVKSYSVSNSYIVIIVYIVLFSPGDSNTISMLDNVILSGVYTN